MRRFWLLILLTLLAAAGGRAIAQDDAESPADAPPPAATPGKLRLMLNPGGHTATVTKVFFTPDSKQVITVSADHTIRIWDALSGESVRVLYPPGFGGLGAAALSPDGKTIAVGSRYADGDKTLHLIYFLSLADGRIERVLKGHPQAVEALAFSADGKRLASTSAGNKDGTGTILIWNHDKDTPDQAFRFLGDPNPIFRVARRGLAFSPDGTRLACVRLSGGPGDILDLTKGKPRPVAKLNGMGPVAWSPDGKVLATAMFEYATVPLPLKGRGIMLWNPDGTSRVRLALELKAGEDGHAVAFSADSRTLLATWGAAGGEQCGIFDVETGEQLVQTDVTSARHGALSPNGKLAATTTNRGSGVHGMTVWKTLDGKVVQQAWPNPSIFKASKRTGWSADGKLVSWAAPPNKRTFNLANLELGRPLADKDLRRPVHQQGAFSLEKGKVLKGGTVLYTLYGYCHTLVGADRVAVARFARIVLCDAATGKEIRSFHGHHDELNELVPSPDGRFLLSTSADQTLKVWNLEQDRALLSLYVRGNDWIAWTEEGYYAATPGGERLMGWIVDNGIDKVPSFHPAERFRKELYRPDVIKLLLKTGNVKDALATANAALKAKGQPVAEGVADVGTLLPPAVDLQVLEQQGGKVRIKVRAQAAVAGQPVTALRLLVDGRPLSEGGSTRFAAALAQADVEWSITLPPGDHHLAVLARSPGASAVSRGIKVVRAVAAPLPVLHALTIGINKYKDERLTLAFAAKDARDLCTAFQKTCKGGLFRDVKGKSLLDARATRKAVLAAVAKLRKDVKPNDLVVVYFAGHGVKVKDKFYLLTVEAETYNLAKTALSGEDLRKSLGEFPCQVLLILDACQSAGALSNFRPAVDEVTRALIDDECGVTVMCAAMAHEKALEKDGNGLFTRAMVEALTQMDGIPFNRRDRRQYLHHLQAFVFDEVKEASQDRQHPVLNLPPAVESFALRQLPPRTTAQR